MELKEILNQRIAKNCLQLYADGHFKHAAHEAMIQVEKALKEKRQVPDGLFGARLIDRLFTLDDPKQAYIKLVVPLGDDFQESARLLFKGAFSYYRNYTAHDGANVNETICLRIMILASELLDLLGASHLSYADIGGLDGLLKHTELDEKSLLLLLSNLDSFHLLFDDVGAFYDDVLERIGVFIQNGTLDPLFDLGVIEYNVTDSVDENDVVEPDAVGWFRLTSLGDEFLVELKNRLGD